MRTVVFSLHMICLLLMGFIIDQTLSAARITEKDNVKVTSSSQFSDWAPERVIDNNDRNDAEYCRCCSSTHFQLDPWYQLDFGKHYRVQRVYIKSRHDTHWRQCVDGEYGGTCNNLCHCKGNPCNKTTGVCPSGECLPGYHGQQCDTLCLDGKYGSGCKDTCGNCLGHNAVCDKMTGTCPLSCSAGYRDDQCRTECVAGSYGHNCTKKCGKCLDNKPCNVTTGSCENGCSAGYQGPLCDRECNKGRYGINCTQRCGHCRIDDTCKLTSGLCPTGCSAGYQGYKCKTECNDEYYGENCQKTCGYCNEGGICNKTNGYCSKGCAPGYINDYCNRTCTDGNYGDGCLQDCGHCASNKACKKTDGKCTSGCDNGYQLPLCQKECTDGKYGDGCVSQCGRCYNDTVCDKMSGKCTGCAAGFKGVKCDAEETSSEKDSCFVPIGVSIGAILFIEAFVGAVVYIIWKRRQGQAERRSPQEVNIYEMPDRETFASEHPYELNQQSDTIIPTYENTLHSPTNE